MSSETSSKATIEEPVENLLGSLMDQLPMSEEGFEEDQHTTKVSEISKLLDQNADLDTSCLVIIYGRPGELGKRFDVGNEGMTIGRGPRNKIVLDQEAVSRTHAVITRENNIDRLQDLGSTNGTFVNDKRIISQSLHDGDFIKIGRTILKYLAGGNIEAAYHEEIYRLTTVDGLTQIHNRRFFIETLEKEISRSRRYSRELSLAMFDIDRFKEVNDRHGHLAGDQVLRGIADLLRPRIRREDTFARYGGEEFAVILPETGLQPATAFAEKIRRLIEGHEFMIAGGPLPVTVSVGVASYSSELALEDFIGRADQKLYAAKAGGRNRVLA